MNVAIAGGGIGGVATAIALNRAGIRATVYERAPRLYEVGAGMMLWPNATRVLQELGLLDRVMARSGPNTNFLVRSERGKILMNIALGQFEVPALCARRADLLSELLTALPADGLRLGYELTRFELAGSKVRVHFTNGAVAEHHVLIGADGLRSRVRSQLFGACEPIYRGYTVWRGLASYNGDAMPRGCNSETWGAGKRFGILSTGKGRFTWYAAVNVDREHGDAPGGRKQELLKMFQGWHAPVEECIESTAEGSILKNGAYDLAPLTNWGEGCITLLGDAAHPCTPNLGQGGCMALEDALVVAKSLTNGASIDAALRCYEGLRRRRTSQIQRRSLLMGRIGQWENAAVVAGRRAITSLLPARWFEHNLRRVYAYET